MMAEVSLTSEASRVGKGFNLMSRIETRSPLPSDDSHLNNNNNNNISTLETSALTMNTITNNSSRSPSLKNDPMMQITKILNPTTNNKKVEPGIENEDNSSRGNNSERPGQQSPVEKSHRQSSTSLPFEESPKMMVHGNQNSNSPKELQQAHQIHEVEDELINENSEDDDNMVMEEEEDYSENEEMMPGEDEDSDKEEHRITVREALMSRAFHAAKFGSGGKYSSTGTGGTTSRSGMISPSSSSSPGGPHPQVQHHHMGNPLIKNPSGVNGHGVRSDRHGQHHHGHGHHRSSFGSTGSHHNSHHHHLSSSRQQYQQQQLQQHHHHEEPFIKSERKSHPSSPVQCDLKPDSLATESSLNGIGNALLSLASLGSLAALQQSIPNFMANVVGSGGLGHHLPSLQQNQNQQNSSAPGIPTLMNVPLNLTHSNSNSSTLTSNILTNSMGSSNHPHYPHHPHHPQKHSKQQQQQQQQQQQCHLSPNSLISSSLQQAIANLAAGGGVGQGTQNPGSATPPGQGSMPQLILASGQISQGIQGAQLLIPTSQGLMSQTVLTIPITQPGSPQNNMLSPSQQQHLNSTGGGQNSVSGGHHGHNKGHNMNLGHRNICHPRSPSMTPGLPSSASPDFPGASGALPSPLMNLAPHLVGGHLPTIQEKMVLEHNGGGGLNGLRNAHGKRERESNSSHTPGGLNVSALCLPKSSPCSIGGSSHGSDKFSDNDLDDSDQMVDGINLDEIKEFAKAFKLRRLSLGLTQTQVGQALSVTEGPAYSQSAICSALAWQLAQSQSQSYPPPSIHQQPMFEKLDITPKSAQKIKPVLERWMKEAEERYKNGHQNLNEFVGMEPSKKRKRRTSFTPQALEILNNHFERNTHPSGAEITTLAHQLGYEREVIRIWFCNKRQALKNTVRMMSK